MYVDRPRPSRRMLMLPALVRLFFVVIAVTVASLAVLVLPPYLWGFVGPIIVLSLAIAAGAVWYEATLRHLEYRVTEDALEIGGRGRPARFPLSALQDVVRLDAEGRVMAAVPGGSPTQRGRIDSARRYANRHDTRLALNFDGDWVQVSPSDPVAFIAALRGTREDGPTGPPTCPGNAGMLGGDRGSHGGGIGW